MSFQGGFVLCRFPGRLLLRPQIELSSDFYDSLREFAVPLPREALAALKGSALAIDLYTWLAHRLHRVRTPTGEKVSWENLRGQFGQEYANPKDFKKKIRIALRQALAVYPDAKIEDTVGGLILRPSASPILKTIIGHLPPPTREYLKVR